MRARSPTTAMERVAEVCREHSLPLTPQRRLILQELSGRSDHPTVDNVFHAVRTEMREISTVEIGIARRVCHPGAVARYETRMRRHHHLVCLKCGATVDLDDSSFDNARIRRLRSGFRIEDDSIQFRGLCSECAQMPAARRKRAKTSDKTIT